MAVTIDDIRRAAEAIKGQVERTPFSKSRTLSQITGAEVFIKFENLQFTAAFKDRGALYKLLSLTPAERKAGVIAMSAGNHAQAVAYHASRLGIPATIVMPETAPFVKVKHTKEYGARIVQKGMALSDCEPVTNEIATKEGLVFVHPYDDEKIIAGQGTIGIEMLTDVPELEVIVAPIGGGGLISGIATATKAMKPSIRIVGVETALYPSMQRALHGGAPVTGGQSIADGIAVKNAGVFAREICARLVDELLLVSEEAIERAVALLLSIEKTVAEGAGATAFAALLQHGDKFKGRKVGVVLSGGNIDPRLLANVILRELQRERRILTIGVEIEDRPGILAKVATIVGDAGANILEVMHERMFTDLPAKGAELRVTMETRDQAHAEQICAAVRAAGYQVRVLDMKAHH
jgi:threonine dehydratase